MGTIGVINSEMQLERKSSQPPGKGWFYDIERTIGYRVLVDIVLQKTGE